MARELAASPIVTSTPTRPSTACSSAPGARFYAVQTPTGGERLVTVAAPQPLPERVEEVGVVPPSNVAYSFPRSPRLRPPLPIAPRAGPGESSAFLPAEPDRAAAEIARRSGERWSAERRVQRLALSARLRACVAEEEQLATAVEHARSLDPALRGGWLPAMEAAIAARLDATKAAKRETAAALKMLVPAEPERPRPKSAEGGRWTAGRAVARPAADALRPRFTRPARPPGGRAHAAYIEALRAQLGATSAARSAAAAQQAPAPGVA